MWSAVVQTDSFLYLWLLLFLPVLSYVHHLDTAPFQAEVFHLFRIICSSAHLGREYITAFQLISIKATDAQFYLYICMKLTAVISAVSFIGEILPGSPAPLVKISLILASVGACQCAVRPAER